MSDGMHDARNLIKTTRSLMADSLPVEGIKFDSDKPQLALIPAEAITQLGNVLSYGAKKYAPQNWREGIAFTRVISAAMRHLVAISDGEDIDKESGLKHAAQVMANMAFLLEYYNTKPHLDDRYKK